MQGVVGQCLGVHHRACIVLLVLALACVLRIRQAALDASHDQCSLPLQRTLGLMTARWSAASRTACGRSSVQHLLAILQVGTGMVR